jgi:hypothetical protein
MSRTIATSATSDVGDYWIIIDYLLEFVFFFVFVFLRSRFTGPSHEGLNLFEGQGAIFVGIHRLEDFFRERVEIPAMRRFRLHR